MSNGKHVCTKCNVSKFEVEFYVTKDRRQSWCKTCVCKSRVDYRRRNRDQLRDYHAKKYRQNREAIIKRVITYEATKMKTDFSFRLRKLIRGRLRQALIRVGLSKSCGFKDYIGCTPEFLKNHIEAQFVPGMTWDNQGSDWHIDHIVPISHFNLSTKDGLCAANHFSNLRPLWAKDNLAKGTNYVGW